MEAEGRERATVDATKTFNRIVHNDPNGKVRADKLTQRHLEAWRERLESGDMSGRKRGLPSKATVNRKLTSLKAALNPSWGRREDPHQRATRGNNRMPYRPHTERKKHEQG